MAAPTVLSSFIGPSTTTTTSWTSGELIGSSTNQRDLAVVVFQSKGGGTPTISDDSGDGVTWRHFSGLPNTGDYHIWTKRIAAGWDGVTITVSSAVDSCMGVLIFVDDHAIEMNQPDAIHNFATESNSSGNESMAGIAATYPESLVFGVVWIDDNLTVSSGTWATLGAPTSTRQAGSSGGTDCQTYVQWKAASMENTGTFSWAQNNFAGQSAQFMIPPANAIMLRSWQMPQLLTQ